MNRTPVAGFGVRQSATDLFPSGMRRESQTHLDSFRRRAPDSFGQPHKMERVAKFEFASLVWKTRARPLDQTRNSTGSAITFAARVVVHSRGIAPRLSPEMVVDPSVELGRFSDLEISRIYKTRPHAGAVD